MWAWFNTLQNHLTAYNTLQNCVTLMNVVIECNMSNVDFVHNLLGARAQIDIED